MSNRITEGNVRFLTLTTIRLRFASRLREVKLSRLRAGIILSSAFFIAAAILVVNRGGLAAPSPGSATLSTTNRIITYSESNGGVVPNPSEVALSMPNCTAPMSCSTFDITISPTVGTPAPGYDPTQYQIFMEWSWALTSTDYDIFVENAAGTAVVASNRSTADPSSIVLPTNQPPGLYHVVIALGSGAPVAYTGTIALQPKPAVSGLCALPANCTPPRYQSYSAGPGQADDAGEPSLGVDWNPNVTSLKNTTGSIFTTGTKRQNTGGVAFFTSGAHEWRANFDDCPSPALNLWEDVSAVTTQQFVLSDPIGFVDHYSSAPLGTSGAAPITPGRVFSLDLIGGQGDSLGSYSDDDGNTYLPGGTGGPGQGPDHETLGGGPYNPNSNPPPPAQTTAYGSPNAVYYCSQNIVAEAQCSRSDNGGQTFGPAVPIFNPSQCAGGIHGHVKVARDGTIYVPNSSCGTVGNDGVAVSTDNGLTWTEKNIAGSTGSQDPSVGIGQNDIGKPAGQIPNTIYLGWTSGDGHAHVAHSGNRGATWIGDTDVGAPFGVTHAVFPVVVAGDDNRAAFAFVGTGDGVPSGVCNPYGAVLNCNNIWHLYIATTYDGGSNWITIDATPDDPIQQGTVCLEGTTCAGGRNLLDFNDFAIDSEGRGLVGYADGCVSCGNAFQAQSSASHGTITRQSGGRRLFSFFDPPETAVPLAPQMVSAAIQSPSGVLVTWLQPDNGGSPITGYNVYRSTTSGTEVFLASVSGATTTKYFDPTAPAGNAFYYAQAINAIGEGSHCGEVSKSSGPPETDCATPGLTKLTDPSGDPSAALGIIPTPAPPGSDLLKFQIAQPYQVDNVPRLVFTITTDNGQSPQPTGSAWYVAIQKSDGTFKGVHMAWKPTSPATPIFESYTPGANNAGGVDGRFVNPGSEVSAEATSNYVAPFNQVVIVVKASDLGLTPGNGVSITGFVSAVSQSTDPGSMVGAGATALYDQMPNSLGFQGSFTTHNNQVCRTNLAPTALLTANPMSGAAPLLVNFSGAGSTDPDTAPPADTIASYTFNFGDGSPAVTQASPTIQHTYNAAGDYPARLTVTDSRGMASTNTSQVVVMVTGTTGTMTNYALTSNGGVAVASSSHSSGLYPPAATTNGDRNGASWGSPSGGWNDGTRGTYPDNLEVDFSGAAKTISEIRVYTLQNNWRNNPGEPDANTSCSGEGILDFDVQTWNGTAWVTVPGGSVTGNDKAMRVFTFSAITTTKFRVVVNNSRNNWSRIIELEAYGTPGQP